MIKGWTKLAAGVAIMLVAPANAARDVAGDKTLAPVVKPPGYTMPQTEMWELAADSGEIYRIFVSYPDGEPPEDGFPVLYVLDGNAMFAGFAEARRIQEWSDVGKSIVVGVGYPTDQAYDTRRLYDFTAAITQPVPPAQARLAALRAGGREQFLDFLTGKLRTEVAKRHKIDPGRQALFGHSLGGLLALHALYSRPDAFHAIIAASPSLWWNDQAMLAEERDFAARLAAGKIDRVGRLFVVAGAEEEHIVVTWDAEAFARRIQPLSAHGFRSRFELYEDENHITVPSRAVTGALRFAFTWP